MATFSSTSKLFVEILDFVIPDISAHKIHFIYSKTFDKHGIKPAQINKDHIVLSFIKLRIKLRICDYTRFYS